MRESRLRNLFEAIFQYSGEIVNNISSPDYLSRVQRLIKAWIDQVSSLDRSISYD